MVSWWGEFLSNWTFNESAVFHFEDAVKDIKRAVIVRDDKDAGVLLAGDFGEEEITWARGRDWDEDPPWDEEDASPSSPPTNPRSAPPPIWF